MTTTICSSSCGGGEQGVELGDEVCVAGVDGAEREVQFAGLLEFAPELEDGFGCWGGRGERELDVLLFDDLIS